MFLMEADIPTSSTSSSDMPLALAGLHDASLASIDFDWSLRRCTLLFNGLPDQLVQQPFQLVFCGVTELNVPAERPWGGSSAVLEVDCVEPGRYVLVMQSGDEIWIACSTPPMRAMCRRCGE